MRFGFYLPTRGPTATREGVPSLSDFGRRPIYAPPGSEKRAKRTAIEAIRISAANRRQR